MVRRLEAAIERMVDGTIARAFRLRVQPAEIGRRLERAMLDGRAVSVGATLAPNAFEVALNPEDAVAFVDWREALCREMEGWLAEVAYARGITTVGPIRVALREDDAVRRRSVRVEARFDDASVPERPTASPAETPSRLVRLVPMAGDAPAISLHRGPLSVGRARDNDLVLRDPDVSRRHARLEARGSVWHVIDLGSRNGTWVNGARVDEAGFGVGDVLAFGSVRFTIVAG